MGITPANDVSLLQSVLIYGGGPSFGGNTLWTMSNWLCGSGSNCAYGLPVDTVFPGDVLYFSMTKEVCSGQACWSLYASDGNTGKWTQLNDYPDAQLYSWAAGGMIELQNLSSCDQFPSGGATFGNLSLSNQNGLLSPTWTNRVTQGPGPSCNYSVSSNSSTVALSYTAGPTNVISLDSTNWYGAHPYGGISPYTYYWEGCITGCNGGGGGNAPTGSSGAAPNTVVKGWQFLSASQSVRWTWGTGSELRSTVTDSLGLQAVTTYTVP